jgi:hypothetical protein
MTPMKRYKKQSLTRLINTQLRLLLIKSKSNKSKEKGKGKGPIAAGIIIPYPNEVTRRRSRAKRNK